MKASVIIPTKNPGLIFHEVLDAVIAQKCHWDFDILVIDSGSSDETLEYCRSKNVRTYSISPEEFGHGKTRNLAISITTGEYIAMLTHDAKPVNDQWLNNLINIADTDDKIAGVFGRHVAYPSANIFTINEIDKHFDGFKEFSIVSLDDKERYINDIGYKQFLHFFSDNNSLLKRCVWEKYPYPDVNFAEDQIWALTIIEAGYKKGYADDAIVYHSHDYSLIERLQRSFDESKAFNKYFGYTLCPTITNLLKSIIWMTKRDYKYALSNKLWKYHFTEVILIAFDNSMRVLGHYLGSKLNGYYPRIENMLSWDKKLFNGSRK